MQIFIKKKKMPVMAEKKKNIFFLLPFFLTQKR